MSETTKIKRRSSKNSDQLDDIQRETHATIERLTKELDGLHGLIGAQDSAIECAEHNARVYEKRCDEAKAAITRVTKENNAQASHLKSRGLLIDNLKSQTTEKDARIKELEAKQTSHIKYYDQNYPDVAYCTPGEIVRSFHSQRVVQIGSVALTELPKRFYGTNDDVAYYSTEEEAMKALEASLNSEGELS